MKEAYNLVAFTPENVKAFRKSKGMTQQEFANAIGVSQPMVSKAERSADNLTVGYLVKMQQAFDVAVTAPKFVDLPFYKRIWLRIRWFLGIGTTSEITGVRPVTFESFVGMYLSEEL